MNEKQKNDSKKVMLVQQAKDGKTKAVKDMDKDGNIKTVEPTRQNAANLLDVNTNDSLVEAFYKKFVEQASNPKHTGIFVMAMSVLDKLFGLKFAPEEMEKHRVDPAAELQARQGTNPNVQQGGEGDTSQSFQPLDVNKIDRADLDRKGIRWDDLEPHLKAMSYGHKSSALVEMSPEMEPGGLRVPTKGRVSLAEQPDGSLKVIPHYWQEKPNLEAPLYGTRLDNETKANLLETGNAGKVIPLELYPGTKEPCYVSLDPLTNRLDVMRVSELGKVEQIKGRELTLGQQMDFAAGKRITVEKMLSRSGYYFDGHVQINAADKNFKFTYEGLDRNRYAQENKDLRRDNMQARKEAKKEVTPEETKNKLFIPNKLLGVPLTDKQHKEWSEALNDPAKRQGVTAYYMKGLVVPGKGEPQNLWVKPNFEKDKMDFFRWDPDRAFRQGAKAKPAVESEKQYAVNTQGKTDEATRYVKEPLKQGQQKPTESQWRRQDEQYQRQQPPARRQYAYNNNKKGQGIG